MIASVNTNHGRRTAEFATMGAAAEFIVDTVRGIYGPIADGVRVTGEGLRGEVIDMTTGERVGSWHLR
ncbi:hypothetical protein QLT00_gp94 [Gordonia phage Commandaria]|uniref:Uncharacterized protein n=1 Tax=Gordonia phage Commandaria TaxID=3038364 RepID=A0AAF0GIL7_9CAUD|nr:hypothetical protein QLT00_gp94 [Gordonia phage Commandaria]WGH20877.1 hypothetical protein [Gordonia phage Commandaria]